jgi:hypothetical protein
MKHPILRRTASAVCLLLSLPFSRISAQTIIPFTIDRAGTSVAVRFDTVSGRLYQVEHSSHLESALANWTSYPDFIYGLGQNARYHVHAIPAASQTLPPPSSDPQPAEHLFFIVNAYDDGSAVVTWNGSDDSPARAYLA